MDSTGSQADGTRGAFVLDTATPHAARSGFDAFQRAWEGQIGDGFPLPAFSAATARDFRVKARGARVHDVAITNVRGVSALRTDGKLGGLDDQVRVFAVRHGAWTIGDPPGRGKQTVHAGLVLIQHVGQPMHFQTVPNTAATVLVLPAAELKPLIGNRTITGPVDAAETRLLMAHANIVQKTALGLGRAGVDAAHSTLIELVKALMMGRFDDSEPLLAPALAEAAKELAGRHLADPGLSPATLARELHVSIRSLQRAFASTGESAAGYIRQQRLEEARLALTAPYNRLSITELAAYWQFADSSHFTRAFRKRYGCTPTEHARSASCGGTGSSASG